MGCCQAKVVPEAEPEPIVPDESKRISVKKKDQSEIERSKRTKYEKDLEQFKLEELQKEIEKKKILEEKLEIDEWKNRIDVLSRNKQLEYHVLSKKINDFRSTEELANYINNGPGKNDLEKYWMIFLWITENISYNTIGLNSGNRGNNDADSVLRTGLAVCEGFSNLYDEICKLIGLECAKISGFAKGINYEIGDSFDETNHAWNVIKVESKSYYVDSTWSGRQDNIKKEKNDFDPYWFMTPPNIFLESHFSPEIKLHRKCTKEEFEKMHYFRLLYHLCGFKTNQIQDSFVYANSNPFCLELTSTEDCELLVNLKEFDSNKKINDAVIVQKDSTQLPIRYCLIIYADSNRSKYNLEIFAKKKINSEQKMFPFLTSLIFIPSNKEMKKNELEKLIPSYNLTFLDNKIQLLSHKTMLISLDSQILSMEFKADKTIELMANLKKFGDVNKIAGATLVQKNPINSNILVNVICPYANKRLNLSILALNQNDNLYYEFTNFNLMFDGSPEPISFLTKYSSSYPCFIYEPIFRNLNTNTNYKFKFYIENAKVVFFTLGRKQIFIDESETNSSMYEIEFQPNQTGELNLCVKYAYGNTYSFLCQYLVDE